MAVTNGSGQPSLRAFYCYRFFNDFVLLYPVYLILFRQRGIALDQAAFLLAIWSGTVLALEVPSGTWADRIQPRVLIAIGLLAKAGGLLLWAVGQGWWWFALGFVGWGTQEALCSGAQESLLFRVMRDSGRAGDYESTVGRLYATSVGAIAVSTLVGGWAFASQPRAVALLSALAVFLGFLASLFLPRMEQAPENRQVSTRQLVKQSLTRLRASLFLRRIVLYAVATFAVIGTLEELLQLYFKEANLPLAWFGVAACVIMGSQLVGSQLAPRLAKKYGGLRLPNLITFLLGILVAVTALFPSLYTALLFVPVFILTAAMEVYIECVTQKALDDRTRATLYSINSLLMNGSATGLGILVGLLATAGTGVAPLFLCFAVPMLVVSAWQLLKYPKSSPIPDAE